MAARFLPLRPFVLRSLSLLCVVLLQNLWQQSLTHMDTGGLIISALTLALLVLSVITPASGLMALTVGVVMAGPIAALAGSTAGTAVSTEALCLSFLAGGLWRLASGKIPSSPLERPVAAFLAVVTAAGVVEIAAHQQSTAFPLDYWTGVGRHWVTGWFSDAGSFRAWHLWMGWCEALGVCLVAAQVAARADGSRLVRLLVIGMAGAASTSLLRVTEVAWRTNEAWMEAFWRLSDLRVFTLHADSIAGASFFAAGVVASAYLMLNRSAVWAAPLVVLSVALWLTGARIPIVVAALMVPTSLLLRWQPGTFTWRFSRQSVIRVVVVVCLLASVAYGLRIGFERFQSGRLRPHVIMAALDERMTYKALSWLILAEHPWFGVGMGRYQLASRAMSPPELAALYPAGFMQFGENAHDNFLQVLVEFGPLGLLTLVWVIARAAEPAVRRFRTTLHAEAAALCAGLATFMLTWLSSHPLLISEVSLWFFLALGLLMGTSLDSPSEAQPLSRRTKVCVAAGVLLLLSTLPWRTATALKSLPLEHRALGASGWLADDERPYRLAHPHSRWFVPGGSNTAVLPLRWTDAAPSHCLVSVVVEEKVIDQLRPTDDAWREFAVGIPATGRGGFGAIDLTVPPGCPSLRVGRIPTP